MRLIGLIPAGFVFLPFLSPAAPGPGKAPPATDAERPITPVAANPQPAFRIECKHPGALSEGVSNGTPILAIRSTSGIGTATVTLTAKQWPDELVLRAYLRGLESLTLSNGVVKWEASVHSHGDHSTLLHLSKNGVEEPPLGRNSPYWADIRRRLSDGKHSPGLPPAEGWFEVRIPRALVKNTRKLEISWIDFHR